MLANMSQDFLKTYAHSKQEEFLKEAMEHTLSQEILANRKAQKRLRVCGQVSTTLRWLTFIREHI